MKLKQILYKIRIKIFQTPGSILECISATGNISVGEEFTVKNISDNFWIHFEEIGDGYNPKFFKLAEDQIK